MYRLTHGFWGVILGHFAYAASWDDKRTVLISFNFFLCCWWHEHWRSQGWVEYTLPLLLAPKQCQSTPSSRLFLSMPCVESEQNILFSDFKGPFASEDRQSWKDITIVCSTCMYSSTQPQVHKQVWVTREYSWAIFECDCMLSTHASVEGLDCAVSASKIASVSKAVNGVKSQVWVTLIIKICF